jgi:hypothetical protein
MQRINFNKKEATPIKPQEEKKFARMEFKKKDG